MLSKIVCTCSVAVLLGVCIPLAAHHNDYACLARDRTVTIEGVVDAIEFSDPHVVLTIRTENSVIVTAEWRALWELANGWGITRDILRTGDRVAVRGAPYTCEVNRLSLITEVRRLADGWSWTATPSGF